MTMVPIPPPPLSSQSMADLLCTIVLLVRGMGAGNQPFWAYMCIKPSMARAFKEARDKGVFNLEDYGTVLESGDGADVPADVRSRMEKNYGVNHRYEDELMAAVDTLKKQGAL